MTSPRLTIAYSAPPAASLGLLQIEQQPWSLYTGVVSTAAMTGALRSMLFGDEVGSLVDCGLHLGEVVCAIHVYPRRPGLVYQFAASHGRLDGRYEHTVYETEPVNFHLVDRVAPSHPPLAIHEARWLDGVYDADGNEIRPPELTIVGGEIIAPIPVYGSVEVTYSTERHDYTLYAPRREAAIDSFYSAVVFGWYQGGVDWLIIDLPPGIEAFEADANARCGWSGRSGAIMPDDDYQQPPSTGNRLTIVDYCTQEILEDGPA